MTTITHSDLRLIDDVPAPLTSAERSARYYAACPERSLTAKRRYRHLNSKWATDITYLSRGITAWDGEGVTGVDGVHRYTLLAGKSFDGDTVTIDSTVGLGTAHIFECILDYACGHEGEINIIYGGGYDFNMWMRDIPRQIVDRIYHRGTALWCGYRVSWKPGKSFRISRVTDTGKRFGRSVEIFDVVSFFQRSFVETCDAYLGERFIERDMIVRNKALRSSFQDDDAATVARYNDAELTNLLALFVELRARLNACSLRPQRWDGPGAVAAALLKRMSIKDYMGVLPDNAAQAARFAYAGGRFEVLRFGHVEDHVWEYDLNSAYPAALRNVPDLSAGEWSHHDGDPGAHGFALYHVEFYGTRPDLPGPLFRREANGSVCYPMRLTGWYWSPEIETTREYCARGLGTMTVLDAWVFTPATTRKPFEFIDGLYNKRRALKAAHDGSHVGLKLALNSLYGKLAQQIGWKIQPDGTLRLPPFHQIEWAGYTTSWCRANVLRACLDDLESVVAFETDAVFTSRPLNVPVSDDLGAFGMTVFDSMTYVQSGTYFATIDGEEIVKTRGVDRCRCPKGQPCECGSLTRPVVLDRMREPLAEDRKAEARLTRFVGAGIALAQSWDRWRRWETVVKRITLEPMGKRLHVGCRCTYKRSAGITLGEWHTTVCPMMHHAHSTEFPIEWLNPDPNMAELEEMRRAPDEYE